MLYFKMKMFLTCITFLQGCHMQQIITLKGLCKLFALPHGAVGWYAVCDCGISQSYPLTF